jgi:small subunit ribosomal protein S16
VLKIRLKRAGGKNHPFFRVVVVDSRRARDTRAVEELGYYNPLEKPMVVNVDRERVAYWTERGAQPSDSVRTLLKQENTSHPTRRIADAFEAAPPPEKPAPKAKKAKAAKAEKGEGAVAVAEADTPEGAGDGEAAKPAAKAAKPAPAGAEAEASPDAGSPEPSEG